MIQNKHKTIIEQHGEDVIKNLWHKLGYRRAADRLGISVGVLRTIVRNKQWKKPAKYLPNVLKAIQNGSASMEEFPHVSFDPDINETTPTVRQFLCHEDIEITLVPDDSNDDSIHDKTFSLQININKTNLKED